MGIDYLDWVVFESDARMFGEGGRGNGRLRIFPDGSGYFNGSGGECIGGSEEYEHLLLYLCLPRRVGGGWER